jgi:hypothetical protein|tara:strand:- start:881 stop:1066 length:186 start_codon:yes stop_codon:yes gene_type:complete
MNATGDFFTNEEATLIAKEIALAVLSNYQHYPSIVNDLDLSDEALEELHDTLDIDLQNREE